MSGKMYVSRGGGIGKELTFTTGAQYDGYHFRCVVTDREGGSETSKSAVLTVMGETRLIRRHPASVIALIGDTVTYTVEASGDGLTYQWEFLRSENDVWAISGMSGNKTASITLEATSARNGYQYRCVVTDGNGDSETSEGAKLTVVSEAGLIARQPASAAAPEGETARFSVETNGDGLSYRWQMCAPDSEEWVDCNFGGETAKVQRLYLADANGLTKKVQRAYMVDAEGLTKLVYKNSVNIAGAAVTLGASLIYNASSQTQTVASVVVDGVTLVAGTDYVVSGNTETNAGNYTLTITGIGDYEGSISSSWSIAKLNLTKPTVSGSFTYDESTKTCTISNMNSTYITQSGTTSATNAGTYTVTFTLKSTTNTCWEDGTTAAISRTWTIGKATGSISVSPASLSIVGGVGSTASATITYIGDGEISVASSATDIVTVERTDATIVCTSVSTGSAIVTITMAEDANYTGASCTINVQSTIAIFGSYDGKYENLGTYIVNGTEHELYRLINDGELVLNGEAQYWICGGGAGGSNAYLSGSNYESQSGSGGGGGYIAQGSLPVGNYVVMIGAGGTSFAQQDETTSKICRNGTWELIDQAYGGNESHGTSGGGGGLSMSLTSFQRAQAGGQGTGDSTYPFGITNLGPHCAGGAAGRNWVGNNRYGGANGGSCGEDGETLSASHNDSNGLGGSKGGGNSAADATFYGGGGGGGSASGWDDWTTNPGNGFQGVAYILT